MPAAIRMFRVGLLLVAVLAGTAGCSFWDGFGGEADNPMQSSAPTSLGVVVENRHWSDMVVYVVSSGRSQRLGLVTTTNRESFELSRNVLSSNIYLRAEAVGSTRSVRTDILNVGEGDVVIWTLENQLGLSDWVIR